PFAEELAGRAAMAVDNAQLHRDARATEERYRRLFADSPLPMWVYDLHSLAFLEVNDSAVSSYGYSRDEFLAMRITDIRPPDDIPKLIENLEGGAAGYRGVNEWRHRLKDGRIIDVEISAHTTRWTDH